MTASNFVLISLVILPFLTNGQKNKNDSTKATVREILRFEEKIEDAVEPPPPNLISNFKTLQEWLFNICDKDKPQKPIVKYKFGLFESPNEYTVFLVGINTYREGEYRTIIRTEFEPTNMYFKLPETFYENVNREQLLDKLTSELKRFANTEKFKTSFFTKANIVVFETNGKTIWSKQ